MTTAQKTKKLKELAERIEAIRAKYAAEYAKLIKRQKQLMRKVAARAESDKISQVRKQIKRKSSK